MTRWHTGCDECLIFQRGYLAEPLNEEETAKINTYLTICEYYYSNDFFSQDFILHVSYFCLVQQMVEMCKTPGGSEASTFTKRSTHKYY